MRYVGIDWASEIHLVALLDASGSVLDQWEVEHTHRGIAGLLGRLEREGGSAEILVGIESGAPLLEDQLLDAGYTVYAINPKRADRFRDRHSPAGAKDDRRDARVLADAVRTDRARFVPLTPNGELTEELRMRDRACERAVQHRVRAELQLRAVLARFHPALLRLERALHDGFLLAMLEAYPDPAAARRARRTRVERLLKEHRIRALDADRILVELRAPAFAIRAGVPAAARDEALDLARQIRLLNEQIRQAHRRIKELFAHHDDHDLAMSLPGLADKLAPRILAELGDDERRRTEPEVLTVYAGVAPVTRATGTRKKPRRNGQRAITRVAMRRGCNRRLQTAMWLMARTSLAKSRWAKAYVAWDLSRGTRYNTALRALSYKWGKILAQLLGTRQHYDEDVHIKHLLANDIPWARSLALDELPQPRVEKVA